MSSTIRSQPAARHLQSSIAQCGIESIRVSTHSIPTDRPEADGTLAWNETTVVVVETQAAGLSGIGFTYGNAATAELIRSAFVPELIKLSALSPARHYDAMRRKIRNSGQSGIAALAVSAIDISLWDLKARLLGCSLVDLLGAVRDAAPLYGSGGFTTYSLEELGEQLSGWAKSGFSHVKMKLSGRSSEDCDRVRAARDAIGSDVELFVDANGAYDRQSALAQAVRFQEWGVRWFEEPVTSDDLDGLAWLCQRAPAGMNVAAGEYGFELQDFDRLIQARAVHVLQADATRCGGITGFLKVAALAEASCLPLSAHCAPQIHAHLAAALPRVVHVEYFHDHARADAELFDGVLQPIHGQLIPDRSRSGTGLVLKVG